ncbi:hypothetical protein BKA67DRAFT_542243 [Truncatella angustata]|uniref:C2H2-type domain-containing protein n=1 Tax=Truncatella angustata TaxID=152316 RepID=A0A9P8RF49_9PEZI|nr:uncharacterized protein BKA67DRAFT_542243 [Truncatella angustata]KAH6643283.1 hypothetical protein BKA67DRAFT_542243 [Truncatella angustata]
MSVSVASAGVPYQPFQCLVCQSRFTRHENLKRHAALHSRVQGKGALPCNFCAATFSRNDLRHRHVKRKHPEQWEKRGARGSRHDSSASEQGCSEVKSQGNKSPPSVSPSESHAGWSPGEYEGPAIGDDPWRTVTMRDEQQHGSDPRAGQSTTQLTTNSSMSIDHILEDATASRPSLSSESYPSLANSQANSQATPFDTIMASCNVVQEQSCYSPSNSPPQIQDDWSPTDAQIGKGCDLFFAHVSHFLPFLHQSMFDDQVIARHLLLSVLCLAYQYGEDPDLENQPGSGASLSRHCFHQARGLIAFDEASLGDAVPPVTLVQAYLMLQICSMMYLCGKDSTYGLKMHSKMISHARSAGLMQPISTHPTAAGDLDSLWREFVRTESLKRTLFAVHQIDALWYQFLSVPRQLSHLEVKHDLPCPENHWNAASAAEWAHQQLVSKPSGLSMKYPDAVRRFLSSDADLTSLPAFDPYGAINITQFLISSAREISGWSTMTGMISLERFEPLKASLVALGPFIRQQPNTLRSEHGALCEATWETAMIELQVWSPSHVGGIVEESIDSLLNQSTYLSPHVELLCESTIAKAVQPHVDWFLRYLDDKITPEFEAPWVLLYAYKAFLIAWQLVRGGMPGAMDVVGVHDGDVQGALAWARKVFQRRRRWQLGKLILGCLETLGR